MSIVPRQLWFDLRRRQKIFPIYQSFFAVGGVGSGYPTEYLGKRVYEIAGIAIIMSLKESFQTYAKIVPVLREKAKELRERELAAE
jgi:hypothetical protein